MLNDRVASLCLRFGDRSLTVVSAYRLNSRQLTGTGRANRAAAWAVAEAKTWVWAKFVEAMEAINRPRRNSGKPSLFSTNTVYSGGGQLLTSTGDIVGRWKEYFNDLLNSTDTPSIEGAEAGDS